MFQRLFLDNKVKNSNMERISQLTPGGSQLLCQDKTIPVKYYFIQGLRVKIG